MGYCPKVVWCFPLADLNHLRLTSGSQKLPASSSRSERHLHFAVIRLCLALLFIISICGSIHSFNFQLPRKRLCNQAKWNFNLDRGADSIFNSSLFPKFVKHHLAFLLHITLVLRFDGAVCGVRRAARTVDVRRTADVRCAPCGVRQGERLMCGGCITSTKTKGWRTCRDVRRTCRTRWLGSRASHAAPHAGLHYWLCDILTRSLGAPTIYP